MNGGDRCLVGKLRSPACRCVLKVCVWQCQCALFPLCSKSPASSAIRSFVLFRMPRRVEGVSASLSTWTLAIVFDVTGVFGPSDFRVLSGGGKAEQQVQVLRNVHPIEELRQSVCGCALRGCLMCRTCRIVSLCVGRLNSHGSSWPRAVVAPMPLRPTPRPGAHPIRRDGPRNPRKGAHKEIPQI